MVIKAFKRPNQTTPENQALTQAMAEYTDQLQAVPFLRGTLLTRIVLGTTPSQVPHSLGAAPQGWWIVRQNASATVYEGAGNPFTDRFITLKASAACTVDIWVF